MNFKYILNIYTEKNSVENLVTTKSFENVTFNNHKCKNLTDVAFAILNCKINDINEETNTDCFKNSIPGSIVIFEHLVTDTIKHIETKIRIYYKVTRFENGITYLKIDSI